MIKRIGLSAMLLAGLLALAAPRPADAKVRFGISVGAPVYSYPAYPAYSYPAYPAYGYNYDYPAPVYTYPAPTYVTPYAYGGYYGGGWRDHDRHESREHERQQFRGRGERGWRR